MNLRIFYSKNKELLKYLFIALTLISIFSAFVPEAFANTNLIANPGFESTPLQNWTFVKMNGNTPLINSTVSHSGRASVKIQAFNIVGSSGYPISQPIKVQPNKVYIFSLWGRVNGVTNEAVARINEYDANDVFLRERYISFSSGTVNWTQKQKEFKTLTNTDHLRINMNIYNGYGTFWVDDVSLSLKNITNLIANAGFESIPSQNWTFVTINGNTPTINNTISHSGKASVKIQAFNIVGSSGYSISEPLKVQPNQVYIFSMWGKVNGITNEAVARIGEYDANNVYLRQQYIPFSTGTVNWTQNFREFTTLANTDHVIIYTNIFNGYGSFWVDDVYLSRKTDTIQPSITINYPTNGLIVTNSSININGLAQDNVELNKVEVMVGTGSWMTASGTISWRKSVGLLYGSNTIRAKATDIHGNSKETSLTVRYKPIPSTALKIGNMGYGDWGYASFQNKPNLTWDLLGNLDMIRPGNTIIWEKKVKNSVPTTNFTFIGSRFDLATQNRYKNWTYGTYLLDEELFHPSVRAQWFPTEEGLKTWDIEGSAIFAGVTIKHLKPWYIQKYGIWNQTWWDGVKSTNKYDNPIIMNWSVYYGYNLHKAWNLHMRSLGKKSAIVGAIGLNDMYTFERWFYPSPMWEYLINNYDLIFTYQYPECVTKTLTPNCKRDVLQSEQEVKQLRERYDYKGKLIHILTTKFSDGSGTDNETVQFEEFKAVAHYVDVIMVYPYTNFTGTPLWLQPPYPPRLIKFYGNRYG